MSLSKRNSERRFDFYALFIWCLFIVNRLYYLSPRCRRSSSARASPFQVFPQVLISFFACISNLWRRDVLWCETKSLVVGGSLECKCNDDHGWADGGVQAGVTQSSCQSNSEVHLTLSMMNTYLNLTLHCPTSQPAHSDYQSQLLFWPPTSLWNLP